MVFAAVDLEKEEEMCDLKCSSDSQRNKNSPSVGTQILLAMACAMVHMGIGTILSFSGVTLPQLLNPTDSTITGHPHLNNSIIHFNSSIIPSSMDSSTTSEHPFDDLIDVNISSSQVTNNNNVTKALLTDNEAAFFSSAAMLGAAMGSAISGPLMVVLGPRTTLLIGIPLTFTAWVILTTTDVISVLLLSRLFQGIAMGVMSLGASLFVVEVSHRNIRGPLSASLDMARNMGVLIMFVIGATEMWWRYQAIIVGLITTIPNFILLIFLKNSPRWLAAKGKFSEAYSALVFYRGNSYNIDEEFSNIEEITRKDTNSKNGLLSQLQYLTHPRIAKLVFFCGTYALAAQLTGTFAIIAYAVPIMKDAVPSLNPYIATLLLGLVRTLGGVSFMCSSSYLGRSITYFTASMTCSISLTIVGVHMYLQSNNLAPEWSWWVPIFGILIFTAAVAVAIPVAGLQVGELLPLRCRALAYGMIDVVFYGSAFMVSVSFPYLRTVLHTYGVFWLYAASCFIFAWMPLLCLPETLGKHLEDIEKSLLKDYDVKTTNNKYYGTINQYNNEEDKSLVSS